MAHLKELAEKLLKKANNNHDDSLAKLEEGIEILLSKNAMATTANQKLAADNHASHVAIGKLTVENGKLR